MVECGDQRDTVPVILVRLEGFADGSAPAALCAIRGTRAFLVDGYIHVFVLTAAARALNPVSANVWCMGASRVTYEGAEEVGRTTRGPLSIAEMSDDLIGTMGSYRGLYWNGDVVLRSFVLRLCDAGLRDIDRWKMSVEDFRRDFLAVRFTNAVAEDNEDADPGFRKIQHYTDRTIRDHVVVPAWRGLPKSTPGGEHASSQGSCLVS